jgi:site-specific DNA-methyltransferase (adenine-specific)
MMREWVSGDGRIRLINGDCMEHMRGLPDKAFSLAVVDVPYGIGVNVNMGRRKGQAHSGYHKFAGEDTEAPAAEYWQELFRVSVNQIVWGANHFISRIPYDSPCWLLWDKGFSEDVTFAQFELAWTSFKSTCKKFDKSPLNPNRIHPTEKPINLYRWILHNYAKEGDRILDTHGGSMSSVCACHEKGFAITCCELDAVYFDMAVARVQSAMRQQTFNLGV